MSKKYQNKPNAENNNLENSRRDFFKKSALGAGALTLATSSALTSCTTEPQQKTKNGAPVLQGTASTPVPSDQWFAPSEIDVTDDSTQGIKELSNLKSLEGDVQVPFQSLPNILVVDQNVSGKTPGGNTPLFGYNGTVPGPTFRVKGSQDLEVLLFNALSGNDGYWAVKSDARKVHGDARLNPDTLDWQIDGHLYGPHQQHVTNLHTHGLHVSPGKFKSSSTKESEVVHSDNVLLRIIPVQDYVNRVVLGKGPRLMDNEIVGFARYKFHLPRPDGTPHYAGTHWYHPHPHGATFDQVAGGMAGFLIVEGPIDDYIESQFSNNDYKELPLMIQRVLGPTPSQGEAPPAPKGNQKKNNAVVVTANGQPLTGSSPIPTTSVYKNQVIRLRVLNGSVDGKGYLRFMISKGETTPSLINPNNNLYSKAGRCSKNGKAPKNASASLKRWFTDEVTDSRICMTNIAFDGINLIDSQGNYTDLPVEWITIGVANRADLLVNIPDSAKDGDIFTIWGQEMEEAIDADGASNASGNSNLNLKIAQFKVVKRAGGELSAPSLNPDKSLAISWTAAGKVEDMLMPIGENEITISDNSETTDAYIPPSPTNLQNQPITMNASGNAGKAIRARRIIYSGFGHASVAAAAFDPNVSVTSGDGVKNSLHTVFNAMLIDGKKYGADTATHQGWDTAQHRMKVNTAEEWSVYNYSMTTYLVDPAKDNTDPTNYVVGVPSYKNGNGSSIPGLSSSSLLRSKAVHHPFHIHQNPFYVRSIQDYEGNELLPLDDNGDPIPRWQDTVYLPHNGGRVIFRSRFWDYTGKYVDHCHLLQHEDWGMMQAIEVVDGVNTKANYLPLPVSEASKQNVFPGLSLKQMFTLDLGKVKNVFIDDSSLKMLCYDPSTTSFFNQTPITNLTAKSVDSSYFKQGNNNQTVNEQNVGYLIEPVPTETNPYPSWNNDLVSSKQNT